MVELTARIALESMMAATADDATPIIRRLARIQARTVLDQTKATPDAAVSNQSDGNPDGWLAVKVNGEGGIVMPYGPLHPGPDCPADPRYRWAPFYLGEPA